MCYWEEQHWIRTKSIHSAEFFHGMLEIVDKNTPVTVFMGEDSQRRLSERVAAFLPKVCSNYEIIDTKDYPMEGISEKIPRTYKPFDNACGDKSYRRSHRKDKLPPYVHQEILQTV